MEQRHEQPVPRARTAGLLIQALPEEVLVYDLDRDQAHCLNQTAASVWAQCDGQTSVADIGARLAPADQALLDEAVVRLALERLSRVHLLTEPFPPATVQSRVSRRAALRTLAKAAAVALPVVTSLVVPTASDAASCLASGQPCLTSAQCCSGICNIGVCF